jgi:Tfp pilus assembly protein PilV
MGLLSAKLRGATLIEALVAIIVVAITFVMSAMMYINIISSDNSFQKLKAASTIREMLMDTYSRKDFMDTTFAQDSITFVKTVTIYPNTPKGIVLSFKAIGPNKQVLAACNELILRDGKDRE